MLPYSKKYPLSHNQYSYTEKKTESIAFAIDSAGKVIKENLPCMINGIIEF